MESPRWHNYFNDHHVLTPNYIQNPRFDTSDRKRNTVDNITPRLKIIIFLPGPYLWPWGYHRSTWATWAEPTKAKHPYNKNGFWGFLLLNMSYFSIRMIPISQIISQFQGSSPKSSHLEKNFRTTKLFDHFFDFYGISLIFRSNTMKHF